MKKYIHTILTIVITALLTISITSVGAQQEGTRTFPVVSRKDTVVTGWTEINDSISGYYGDGYKTVLLVIEDTEIPGEPLPEVVPQATITAIKVTPVDR